MNRRTRFAAYVSFVFFVFLAGCASQKELDEDRGALNAAQVWLVALDNYDEDRLWLDTSELTKNKEGRSEMLKYWTGIRKGFGVMHERDLQYNFTVEPYQFRGNIPNGTYRDIMFWTKYEKRELVKEKLFMSYEEGQWKVLQYRAE